MGIDPRYGFNPDRIKELYGKENAPSSVAITEGQIKQISKEILALIIAQLGGAVNA